MIVFIVMFFNRFSFETFVCGNSGSSPGNTSPDLSWPFLKTVAVPLIF